MSDDTELVRGSGNIFRDFDMQNSELERLRATLAAQISMTLDKQKLSVRGADAATGINYAEFSRIRNVKLDGFSVDRLWKILDLLGQVVDVKVKVRSAAKAAHRSRLSRRADAAI
jgi:predicted XRE-type DNA-binding protein